MTKTLETQKHDEDWHKDDWLDGLALVQGDLEALAGLFFDAQGRLALPVHEARRMNFLVCSLHRTSDDLERLLSEQAGRSKF